MFGKLKDKLTALRLFLKYNGKITQLTLSQIIYPEILKNRKIIITGGSDGIGLAMARKCIQCGATVLITGRSIDKLESASASINSDRLLIQQWDVSECELIPKNINLCINKLGG